MKVPYYDTVIGDLTQQIDVLSANFLQGGYNAMASALAAPLASLITLFIVLTGYGITQGLIQTPIKTFYTFIIRVGVIYFFAMNWGNFSAYAVALFINGSGELGAAIMKHAQLAPGISGGNITQGLQSVFTEMMNVGVWVIKKASFRHPGPIFTAFMIWISGIIVVLLALYELVVAKLMLSLCLSTAPLFFLFILFEQTRSIFDRWLGFLVGFSLVLVMVSGVVGLSMSLMHWTVASYAVNQAENADLTSWIPIFIVSCLCFAMIWQADTIAKSIGGGCHTATGTAMVGDLFRKGKEGFTNMKDKHQSIKNWRQARQSGRL